MRVETRVEGGQSRKTADEEAGAGQQHKREPNFCDDKSITDEVATAAGPAAAGLEHAIEIDAGALQRRHQPEPETCQKRKSEGNRYGPAIHNDFEISPRQGRRCVSEKERQTSFRHQQTEACASANKNEAFN